MANLDYMIKRPETHQAGVALYGEANAGMANKLLEKGRPYRGAAEWGAVNMIFKN